MAPNRWSREIITTTITDARKLLPWSPSAFKQKYFRSFQALVSLAGTTLPSEGFPTVEYYNALWPALRERYGDMPELKFAVIKPPTSRAKKQGATVLRYEEHIKGSQTIPMRLSYWHDVFNNFSWLLYPRFKSALIDMCYEAFMARKGISTHRSKEEDFVALCDEASVLEVATLQGSQIYLFGHGLLESALMHRTDVKAMVVPVTVTQSLTGDFMDDLQKVDRAAAAKARELGLLALRATTGSGQLPDLLERGL